MRRRRTGDEAINAGTSPRSALLETLGDGLWAAQDGARRGLRRFFEWVSWALRRWLAWPLQDRIETAGPGERLLGAAAAVLVVAALGAAALLAGGGGGGEAETVAAGPARAVPARPATVRVQAPKPKPAPTLHGATPVFGNPDSASGGGAKSGDGKGGATGLPAASPDGSGAAAGGSVAAAAGDGNAPAGDGPSGAAISSVPKAGAKASGAAAGGKRKARPARGPVAGPRAIAVAREFAAAFVGYEIGEAEEASVRHALGATTTPALKRALLQRPPRLPANVKVPKAKVLNIVPAPSRKGIFPISVSLLRVGTTSELRLELEKLGGKRWRVTNVLG